MKLVFADTSYYVATMNARDAHHETARRFAKTYRYRYVTSEFVLAETATFFLRPGEREVFVRLVADLRANPKVTIVPASADLFEKGLHLFAARPDKE